MSVTHLHQPHAAIAKRLKRAEGHLHSVIEMIDSGRPCLDIAQQLQAVEKAIGHAKQILIRDHVDNCLEQAAGAETRDPRAALAEFKEITKYL
jgi:hypothetical protein NreA